MQLFLLVCGCFLSKTPTERGCLETISVLMATYNGEKFITEQIESLLCQTVQQFNIYINDDCSTDATWRIVAEYSERYPDKIRVTQSVKNTGSAKHNFMNMIQGICDDYVMLCDQDDVWKSDKIEKTLAKMHSMELEYGQDAPLLVHTDLCVVDEFLNEINPSFIRAMNANYNRTSLNHAVIQNTVTGCTAMYNRALATLIVETPQRFVMHDWYLMLVTAAFGHIGYLSKPSILYRQHANNGVGAKDVRTFKYKMDRIVNRQGITKAINDTYSQAESFLYCFRDKLSCSQRVLLQEYCDIPNRTKLQRLKTIVKLGTFKNGITRNIGHFLCI